MNDLVPSNSSDFTQIVVCNVTPELNEIIECKPTEIQLSQREQKAIVLNFKNDYYDVAAEFVWKRTMSILKDRLSIFGESFISDMLGYDKEISIDRISDPEIISLNYDIGFLKKTAKIKLLHFSEVISYYLTRETELVEKDVLTKFNAQDIIDTCIQFVLSDTAEYKNMEFYSIRDLLKSKILDNNSQEMIKIIQGQYFYQRSILRSLINMIKSDKEKDEEKECIYQNMLNIVPGIWDNLSDADKYSFGSVYSEIVNSDKKEYIKTMKTILLNVHGFDYVPENLKSNSFISAAKNLMTVHSGFNNFYNEPLAAKMLSSMGTMIPNPALFECLNSVIICVCGNTYGRSDGAQTYLNSIINGITTTKWELYLKDLLLNSSILYQLAYVGDIKKYESIYYWCELIESKNLHNLNFNNYLIKDFLNASAQYKYSKVREIAKDWYSRLGNNN